MWDCHLIEILNQKNRDARRCRITFISGFSTRYRIERSSNPFGPGQFILIFSFSFLRYFSYSPTIILPRFTDCKIPSFAFPFSKSALPTGCAGDLQAIIHHFESTTNTHQNSQPTAASNCDGTRYIILCGRLTDCLILGFRQPLVV
jgi:hypothetical protein